MTPTDLLYEIARCPNVPLCMQKGAEDHPCYEIVNSQRVDDISDFQVPEPWNGAIEDAPLLYVSSNPTISQVEKYPRWDWPDELVEDFFARRFSGGGRFGGGRQQWVKDGKACLRRDGTYAKPNRYWSEMLNRSSELFGRPVNPGEDYVLTEIVHCKSRALIGVGKATVEECVGRYLDRVLEVSAARVIAAVGKKAGRVLQSVLGSGGQAGALARCRIAGRERVVLFLAAPGSSKLRKIHRVLSEPEIEMVRSLL